MQPEQNPKFPEQEIHRTSPQDNPEFEIDLKKISVSIINNDNQVNAIKDRIDGGIITVFSHEGLELKKTLLVSMGNPELKRTKKYQGYKIVIGLIQFNKFIPNLASSSTPFRELIQKKKIQLVGCTSRCVREKIKKETCNTETNHHYDVKLKIKVKCDASHIEMDASLEQDQGVISKTVAFRE